MIKSNWQPFATVLNASTSLSNKTGSWRTARPEYVKKTPPCEAVCPAGEDVCLWLSLVSAGKFREAWDTMVKANPFPAIMGRACYHVCERACNRGQFDGAVNINLIERSIGDIAIANGWNFEKKPLNSGKRILIIGAGPSGLSAAYFLRMRGYSVTIYESNAKPGGTMRYGVPRYRLPSSILDAEINRIIDFGVEIVCNKKVNNIRDEANNFDALYVSIGACIATRPNVEIKDGAKVIYAMDLFKKLEDSEKDLFSLGEKVCIYGGGNTAIDAARTALRLGAKNVKIIYRRTANDMSAHKEEVENAMAEGIELLCLSSVNTVYEGKILIDKMIIENNNLSKSGETEIIFADSVIFAVGQYTDKSIFGESGLVSVNQKGLVEIDENMMTSERGVFCGGDLVSGNRTITNAIAHGRKASKCIDNYLQFAESSFSAKSEEVVNFKQLNTAYFKKNVRVNTAKLVDISFNESTISYPSEKIIAESSRCFSCGNCFRCDNCYGYCPDNAIEKHTDGSLEINYDYCKGCGICSVECPCGAIKMISEK